MKKMIFLLMVMCITFTGCKKDKDTEQNLNAETTSVQMETNADASDTERISTTTTASPAESTDTETSTSTGSAEKQTSTTTTTSKNTNPSESTEISLDAGNALRQAVMDEEERQAIEAVQPSEQLLYYKNPVLDFDSEGYANLHIGGFGFSMPGSQNGSNVHQYFFESRPMSGTDILYLQKASEGYSGIAFDADQVKSSTGVSLEDSECLTYQNDSAYFELHRDGTCMMYNKENISGILGQEVNSTSWNPLQGSKSSTRIYSARDWLNHIPGADDGFIPISERNYPLNGEYVNAEEAGRFLWEYLNQAVESGWISSNYQVESYIPAILDLIEYENGNYGYLFTFPFQTNGTFMGIDYTEKTAYLNPDRATKGQYIQVLMLSKDSVDYISLPSTLTRSPDYKQTLSGTYCTLAEACEILSAYLNPNHVYEVENIGICYETVFLGDLGIVQSPMWHLEVTSLAGEESQYSILYADIDLDSKELYISYQ